MDAVPSGERDIVQALKHERGNMVMVSMSIAYRQKVTLVQKWHLGSVSRMARRADARLKSSQLCPL